MEIYKVILLAIEQGITELLPISSSAHLILSAKLLNFEMDTYFLSLLHLGTTISILIYFSPTLFKDIFKRKTFNFYLKIVLSTIPVAIIGLLFESTIENILRGDLVIVISLILWGIVMITVEKTRKNEKEIDLHDITWKQSLVMGASQILALIPGTSRSGITTISGILTGVNKYVALQYSFILGIPVLLGASGYVLFKNMDVEQFTSTHLLGVIISAVVGILALQLLKKVKRTNWLTVFGYYRIFLGIVILLTILF
ncbi:MAG: undecaprenyl-diphosphate phosphatase [Candidatus Dojkabacteria bacterium]